MLKQAFDHEASPLTSTSGKHHPSLNTSCTINKGVQLPTSSEPGAPLNHSTHACNVLHFKRKKLPSNPLYIMAAADDTRFTRHRLHLAAPPPRDILPKRSLVNQQLPETAALRIWSSPRGTDLVLHIDKVRCILLGLANSRPATSSPSSSSASSQLSCSHCCLLRQWCCLLLASHGEGGGIAAAAATAMATVNASSDGRLLLVLHRLLSAATRVPAPAPTASVKAIPATAVAAEPVLQLIAAARC